MKSSYRIALLLTLAAALAAGAAAAWQQPTGTTITTLFIVRHAEKAGEDRDPDLSEAGRRRAQTLEWILRDVPLAAVYSTEWKRTRQTVAPIARRKNLEIVPYDPSAERLADTVLKRHAGRAILLCGHSNTVPALLRSLGVDFSQENLEGFDDLFIVTVVGGDAAAGVSVQHLHYPGGH